MVLNVEMLTVCIILCGKVYIIYMHDEQEKSIFRFCAKGFIALLKKIFVNFKGHRQRSRKIVLFVTIKQLYSIL
jgi:hypothetical protein